MAPFQNKLYHHDDMIQGDVIDFAMIGLIQQGQICVIHAQDESKIGFVSDLLKANCSKFDGRRTKTKESTGPYKNIVNGHRVTFNAQKDSGHVERPCGPSKKITSTKIETSKRPLR